MKTLHRNIKTVVSLIVFTLLCGANAFAQKDKCTDLQNLIDQTYTFKPSKLTEAEKTKVSAEMDVVWNKVKADRENLVPCLKKAMTRPDANNFFVFDASNLIMSLNQSDESKKLLIKSYAQVDLADVNLAVWLPRIAVLGFEGFDTTAAGENWLRSSVEGYYLPQHGTRKVTKDLGSLVIYGSMKEEVATPALINIAFDKTHPGRNSAVLFLYFQATPEAFRALKKLSNDYSAEIDKALFEVFFDESDVIKPREGQPKTSRAQYLAAFQDLATGKSSRFRELVAAVPDGEKDAVAVLEKEDIPLVRKARRYFAALANPHTGQWYESFTNIILTLERMPESKEKSKK